METALIISILVSSKRRWIKSDYASNNILPSVNQLSAEIKITEAWKIMNINIYQITLEENNPNRNTGEREVRASTQREWKEHAKYKAASESFTIDTAKLWNKVDPKIKAAQSLGNAKSLIKKIFQNFGNLSYTFNF